MGLSADPIDHPSPSGPVPPAETPADRQVTMAEPGPAGADRTKAELRRELLAARQATVAQVRADANAALLAVLAEFVRWRRPRVLAGYAPVGPEPGGRDLPEVLVGAARRPYLPDPAPDGTEPVRAAALLLPVLLVNYDLDWARYDGPGSLADAARGLREPVGPRLGVDAIGAADLVVVPALAVDRSGHRLGRGAGSYDRALTRTAPDALVIALVYDDELVDTLPAQPHDRRVDAVLTPSGGVRQLR